MLIDPAIALFCTQLSIMTPGNVNGPCVSALNATSASTNTTLTMNQLESYSQNLVKNNINEELIKTLIATGFLINSYNQRQVIAQFPLKPFEFNVNLSLLSSNFGLKYKYEF
jgi:hypothetical protein